MTLSEVTNISGDAGDLLITVKEHPRYVDMDKCIACGECAAKCPKKVDSEYDAATGKRKAIYVKYAQAVPLKYQIDAKNCIRFKKAGACGFCETLSSEEFAAGLLMRQGMSSQGSMYSLIELKT